MQTYVSINIIPDWPHFIPILPQSDYPLESVWGVCVIIRRKKILIFFRNFYKSPYIDTAAAVHTVRFGYYKECDDATSQKTYTLGSRLRSVFRVDAFALCMCFVGCWCCAFHSPYSVWLNINICSIIM